MSINHYNNPLSHEDFIDAWLEVYEEGGDLQDVADRLRITKNHARSRVDRLRRMGVKLPSYRDRQIVTEDDIDNLNNRVAKWESKR